MYIMLIVFATIVALVLIAWAILALVTHITGKRFDREWQNLSPEERRRLQESTCKSNLYAQSTTVK